MNPLENASLDVASPMPLNEPEAAELPPPFPGLIAGEVPAVLIPPISQELFDDPTIQTVVEKFEELPSMGLDYFEAQDRSTVIYNPSIIQEDALIEADKNGTLAQIAVPLIGGAEEVNPLADAMTPPAMAPKPQNSGGSLQTARLRNINPPQVSPIQPNPIEQQLARRPI